MRMFGRGHLTLEELSAYLDGRGPDRGHLAGCEVCRRELASLEATRGYLSSLSEVAVPRSFMPMAAEPVRSEFGWFGAMRMATAGVAALLVFAVGVESYAGGVSTSAPAMGRLASDSVTVTAQGKADAPAAAPALRSAPAAGGAVATATVVVQEERRSEPGIDREVSRGPSAVTSGLGVIFVLLFAATVGLWIRERSS